MADQLWFMTRIQEEVDHTNVGIIPRIWRFLVIVSVDLYLCFAAQSVCHRLIKSLIPATVVPETAVLKLVSVVCANIPASPTQVHIRRVRKNHNQFEFRYKTRSSAVAERPPHNALCH